MGTLKGNVHVISIDTFKLSGYIRSDGEGASRIGDLLDLAVEQDIVEKSGAWYSYGGERIGQGRENARSFLKEHPDLVADIERKVRLGYGLPVVDEAEKPAKAAKAAG